MNSRIFISKRLKESFSNKYFTRKYSTKSFVNNLNRNHIFSNNYLSFVKNKGFIHQKRLFYVDKQYIYNDLLEDVEMSSRGTLSSKVINLMKERPSNFTKQIIKILLDEPKEFKHLVPFHAEIIYYCLMEYAPLDNLDLTEKLFQFFFVSNYADFIADSKLEKPLSLESFENDSNEQNGTLDELLKESSKFNDKINTKELFRNASINRNAQYFDWDTFIKDIVEIRRLLTFDSPIRIWRNSLCFLPLLEAYAYHGQIKHLNSLIELSSLDMGYNILFDTKWGIMIANSALKAFKHSTNYLDMIRWFVLWFQCEENQRQAPLIPNEETYHILFNILPSLIQLAKDNEIRVSKKDAQFFFNVFKDVYESLLWQKQRQQYVHQKNPQLAPIRRPPNYYLPYTKHFQPVSVANHLMLFLSQFYPELGFELFEDCIQSSLNEDTIENKIPSTKLIYRSLIDCATKLQRFDRIQKIEEIMEKDFLVFGREDLNPRNESSIYIIERFKSYFKLGKHKEAFSLFFNNVQHNENNFDEKYTIPNSTMYAVLLQGFSKIPDNTFWIIYRLCEQDDRIKWNHVMCLSALSWMKDKNQDALLYLFTSLFNSPLIDDPQVKERLNSFTKSNAYKEYFSQFEPIYQGIEPDLTSISILLKVFLDRKDNLNHHLLIVLRESFDFQMCTNVYNFLLNIHLRALDLNSFWKLYKEYEQYIIDRIAIETNKMKKELDLSIQIENNEFTHINFLESTDPGNERTRELIQEAKALEHIIKTSKDIIQRIL